MAEIEIRRDLSVDSLAQLSPAADEGPWAIPSYIRAHPARTASTADGMVGAALTTTPALKNAFANVHGHALRPAVRKRLTRPPLPTAARLTGYDQRTFGKRDRDGFD
jgi:hypothetical protein